eukprot:Em0004g599a
MASDSGIQAPSDGGDVASQIQFHDLCALMEKIHKTQGTDKKKTILSSFIERWRETHARLHHTDAMDTFFAIMRLLLPELDRARPAYGMKETALAKHYIEVLNISKESTDAQKLLHYRAPQIAKEEAGDLADVVLISRFGEYLDDLANGNTSKDRAGMKKALQLLLRNTSALEQKWLIRIILKGLKTGLSENSVFSVFHPDAVDLFSVCSNLEKVGWIIDGETIAPILTDKAVTFTTCSITFTRCATSPATSICTSARKGRGRSRSVYISVGFEGLHTSHGLFSSYHTILKLCIWNMVVIFSTIRTPQRPLGRGIPVGGASVLPQNLHLGFEVEVAGYMSKMVNNSVVCCDEFTHKSHSVKEIPTVAKTHQMEITGALEDAKEVVTKLTGAIEGNNRMIEQVEISKRTAFLAINQAFEILQQTLEERKKTLLSELEAISLSKTTALTLQKEHFEKMTHTDHEIVALGGLIPTELQATLKRVQTIFLTPNQHSNISVSVQTDDLVRQLSKLGEIIVFSPSLSSSTWMSTSVGTRYHVKVQSKTSKGEEYPHGGVEMKGEMRSKTHNGAVVYGEVEDHRYGTYTITLTPQMAGPHQLLITMDGQQKNTIGSSGSDDGQFSYPSGISIKGEVFYVADTDNQRVQKLTSSGKFLHKFGKEGSGQGQFNGPVGVIIDSNNKLIVSDFNNHRIQIFNENGGWLLTIHVDGKGSGNHSFQYPWGLALDPQGNIHVAAFGSNVIKMFTKEGVYVRMYGDPKHPRGIAIDGEGYSLVSEWGGHCLSIYDPEGNKIHTVGILKNPLGTALDPRDGTNSSQLWDSAFAAQAFLEGTNGSQLWDSAFAAQAFLEVRTKQGMGKTTAAANQTEDGDWSGDYRGPLLDGWEQKSEMKQYPRNVQRDDVGWGLYTEGKSTVFGTALNYVTMRLLGVIRDVARARTLLHHLGGAVCIPSWGKFWLAVLNVYHWNGVHCLSLSSGGYWVYLPMGYCYALRLSGKLTKITMELREELYTQAYDTINWASQRNNVAPGDVYTPHSRVLDWSYRILNTYEPWHVKKLRSWAVSECLDNIRADDQFSNCISVGPTYQQPLSTAAEPSKQSEVLIDACEHPVDKGNVITDTLWNFRRSEELCGSGRKFQLSWKVKDNWIDGQMPCLLFSLYKCCQVANANYITREGFICSICSKTQIIPALNNDPRMVKSHCSDFLRF